MRATSFRIMHIKHALAILAKRHAGYLLAAAAFFVLLVVDRFSSFNVSLPCLFKAATGHECPGCGLTRAFQALLVGQFSEAWHFNPLAFFILPVLVILLIVEFRKTYHLTLKQSKTAYERR